jgi:hypothetical protein
MTNSTPTPHSADPVVSFLYQLAAKEAKDCQFEKAVKIRACADAIAHRDVSHPAPPAIDISDKTVAGIRAVVLGLARSASPDTLPAAQPVNLAELRDPDFS